MFFYQALIMLIVVIIICLLVFVMKIKHRVVLAVSVLLLACIGAGALCLVQNYFGTRFYVQKIDENQLSEIRFSDQQKGELKKLFAGYTDISSENAGCTTAIGKKYDIRENGTQSSINTDIYVFDSAGSAQQFLKFSQTFYENRKYLPADKDQSQMNKKDSHQAVVSYIKSYYRDYNDFMYLPSKISYLSSVTVLDGNVVVVIDEQSNRQVTNKGEIIQDILKALNEAA